MTGTGGDTGRGVRVAARGLRTWRRLVDLGIAAAVAVGISTGAWKAWNAATSHEWHVMGVYVLSELLLTAGFHPDKTKTMRGPDGSVHVAAIGTIAGHGPILELRDRILDDVFDAALAGVGIGAAAAAGGLAALRSRGRRLGRGRRLRGGELVSARELAGRVMPLRHRLLLRAGPAASRPYAVAGIVWPADAETSHTIVSGTTGSGKTVLIADLVQQIRAHGERCVVYDKMGSYTEAFFDKSRDVLLNPLDARTPRWSPFLEARTARDFDTMAAALIPRQKDAADPFWITAARQLFSHGAAVLWKGGETRNRVLVDRLLKTELSELAEAMEGTVAQSIVDPANPKTALSVRAMLTANIGAMDVLPDEGDPFSIREWIERDGEGCLFLTSRGDQHASLRGLISTWLEIAVNALLSLPRADGAGNAPARRIWLILDELPTLHQLPSLKPGLAESRQFGGCFVLGVRVFSALRDLYGRDGAQTISGLCGTRVVLAAPDKDTSEWSAESLGRVEMESLTEGVSYETGERPGAARGGVTLSTRRDLRPLVLPSEVARLQSLSGYIKFPGRWPVARIRLRYRERHAGAARFVPRAEGGGDTEPAQDGVNAAAGGADPTPEAPRPDPSAEAAERDGGEVPETEDAARAGSPADAAGPLGSEPDWLFEGTVPAAEPAGGRKRGPGGGGGEAEDGQQKPLKRKPGATRI
ncbi:MAG: type IV secretion system DNA-binding domain-containing protein [Alphaproteobacteria bacterium]|nr:type IV secretion system DNA-binding domain-containing protein [Alphaproteobacteria bacterium]